MSFSVVFAFVLYYAPLLIVVAVVSGWITLAMLVIAKISPVAANLTAIFWIIVCIILLAVLL